MMESVSGRWVSSGAVIDPEGMEERKRKRKRRWLG